MPCPAPKAHLDLADLAFHEGVPVLLRRELARLREGEVLEVQADAPELAIHLNAWCRKEGHRCQPASGARDLFRIERGPGVASFVVSGSELAESAHPAWGLA